MEEISKVRTKKRGWLSLSSTFTTITSPTVLFVGSYMIIIILLGGNNPLFASPSLPITSIVDKNTNQHRVCR